MRQKPPLLSGFFTIAFLLLSACAIAQTPGRIQLSAGFSYLGYSVYQIYSGPWRNFGFDGWQASGALRLAPHFSVEGDASGGYGKNGTGHNYNYFTYMGGPRISTDLHRFSLYGHALFGAMNFDGAYLPSATSFAAELGGGADFWLTRHIGVQLIQVDDILNHNKSALGTDMGGPGPRNHLRIATGIPFRL